MTTTVLTDEQIAQALNLSGATDYADVPLSYDLEIARAIEQAVLQSQYVYALREDAERYRALRQMQWFDSPLCVVASPQKNLKLGAFCPFVDELDKAIDAAMEKQP